MSGGFSSFPNCPRPLTSDATTTSTKTFTNLASLVNFSTTPASPGSPQDLLLPPIKSLVKFSYNLSVILELMVQHVVVVVKSLVKVSRNVNDLGLIKPSHRIIFASSLAFLVKVYIILLL